jgi:hypothetical protein
MIERMYSFFKRYNRCTIDQSLIPDFLTIVKEVAYKIDLPDRESVKNKDISSDTRRKVILFYVRVLRERKSFFSKKITYENKGVLIITFHRLKDHISTLDQLSNIQDSLSEIIKY